MGTGLRAAAKLIDFAAVAFRGAGLRGWGEVHKRLAFLGCFLAGVAAGFGFLVERLGDGSGAADVAEPEDVDFEFATFGANLQAIADVDVTAGLDGLVIRLDAVEFAGASGLGAGLEEARGP